MEHVNLLNWFGLPLFSLKDIDECMEFTFQCQDASQTCSNLHGSYKCVCGEDLYWIDNKCQGLLANEFSCYLTQCMAWICSDLSMIWTHLQRIVQSKLFYHYYLWFSAAYHVPLWIFIHTYLLARPHRAFQIQCYSNNIKHRHLTTRKIINLTKGGVQKKSPKLTLKTFNGFA